MKAMFAGLSVVGVLAFSAASAMAQGNAGDMLRRADANQDGVVTLAEINAARASAFTRLDQNSDGQLTGGEVRRQLTRFDANADGVITRSEFLDRPPEVLQRFDANHDNALDQAEIAAARAAMAQRRTGAGG